MSPPEASERIDCVNDVELAKDHVQSLLESNQQTCPLWRNIFLGGKVCNHEAVCSGAAEVMRKYCPHSCGDCDHASSDCVDMGFPRLEDLTTLHEFCDLLLWLGCCDSPWLKVFEKTCPKTIFEKCLLQGRPTSLSSQEVVQIEMLCNKSVVRVGIEVANVPTADFDGELANPTKPFTILLCPDAACDTPVSFQPCRLRKGELNVFSQAGVAVSGGFKHLEVKNGDDAVLLEGVHLILGPEHCEYKFQPRRWIDNPEEPVQNYEMFDPEPFELVREMHLPISAFTCHEQIVDIPQDVVCSEGTPSYIKGFIGLDNSQETNSKNPPADVPLILMLVGVGLVVLAVLVIAVLVTVMALRKIENVTKQVKGLGKQSRQLRLQVANAIWMMTAAQPKQERQERRQPPASQQLGEQEQAWAHSQAVSQVQRSAGSQMPSPQTPLPQQQPELLLPGGVEASVLSERTPIPPRARVTIHFGDDGLEEEASEEDEADELAAEDAQEHHDLFETESTGGAHRSAQTARIDTSGASDVSVYSCCTVNSIVQLGGEAARRPASNRLMSTLSEFAPAMASWLGLG